MCDSSMLVLAKHNEHHRHRASEVRVVQYSVIVRGEAGLDANHQCKSQSWGTTFFLVDGSDICDV